MPATTEAKRLRSGTPIMAYLPPDLGHALASYMESLRPQPDKSAVLRAAIEDFLEGKGFWPPPSA